MTDTREIRKAIADARRAAATGCFPGVRADYYDLADRTLTSLTTRLEQAEGLLRRWMADSSLLEDMQIEDDTEAFLSTEEPTLHERQVAVGLTDPGYGAKSPLAVEPTKDKTLLWRDDLDSGPRPLPDKMKGDDG